jgi:hypothetical protein
MVILSEWEKQTYRIIFIKKEKNGRLWLSQEHKTVHVNVVWHADVS